MIRYLHRGTLQLCMHACAKYKVYFIFPYQSTCISRSGDVIHPPLWKSWSGYETCERARSFAAVISATYYQSITTSTLIQSIHDIPVYMYTQHTHMPRDPTTND